MEGDTSLYLARLLKPFCRVTRIAYGLPVGSELNMPMTSPWRGPSKGAGPWSEPAWHETNQPHSSIPPAERCLNGCAAPLAMPVIWKPCKGL